MENYKYMSKTLTIILLGIFMFSFATALDSIGEFQQGECVEIPETCATCSYVNGTVKYPNSSIALNSFEFTDRGSGLWTYRSFCDTMALGRYDVAGKGDLGGEDTSFATYFTIGLEREIADTWYNITFDLEIDDETISDWYNLTDSNSSITINGFEGIIRVQGCIHPYNDDVGNQEASFYARVLVNGIEARCLQRADSKSFKSDGMDTLDVVGTVVVEDGDVITYQWRTSNTNIQLEGDAVFDNPVAASLNFERLSDLD